MEHQKRVTKLFTSEAKPHCYSKCGHIIAVAQESPEILFINQHELTRHSILQTEAKDRALSLKLTEKLLIRGGSEGTVTLWDKGQKAPIHIFNRPGCKFTAVDVSDHILVGGSNKRMIFWDLRKMKQRCEFTESFNQDITGISFSPSHPTVFHACAMDGLIAKFDLTEKNEEDAFIWGHQILGSPCKLEVQGSITLVQTQDQYLITLEEDSVKQKLTINQPQHPTHILNSFLGPERHVHYYTKNMKNNAVEYWVGKHQIGHISTKVDVEMLIPLSEQKVVFADADGNWAYSEVRKGQGHLKVENNQNFMTVQQSQARQGVKPETEICNKNGFIISKPSSLKSNSKKFKPY